MSLDDRVLDRRPAPETVSPDYPMRTLLRLPAEVVKPIRSYSWRHVQFDQGDQGACTVFDAMTEAAARPQPYWGDPVTTEIDTGGLNRWARTDGYTWVRRNDEWPGEGYEGSSLNAACKLGRALKWWDGWRWALGTPEQKLNDVALTVGYYGPVMFASTWRSEMWRPNPGGYLRYQGRPEGGHAYLFSAVNVARQALWTPNSWGGAGQGWISFADVVTMFGEDAEAAVAVGRKVKMP